MEGLSALLASMAGGLLAGTFNIRRGDRCLIYISTQFRDGCRMFRRRRLSVRPVDSFAI